MALGVIGAYRTNLTKRAMILADIIPIEKKFTEMATRWWTTYYNSLKEGQKQIKNSL